MRFSSIKDNILALSWQDKRNITMLSSYDTGNMKVLSKLSHDGCQLIFKKLEVIINHNKFMGK
ncbi:hypothetical protein H311_01817 [Anncaliia algerae PRA109]|nr:hypothetical protein H311_01817 [Anncaliia algerae PRA109]